MIDIALLQIASSLNQSLRRSFGVADDLVSLASLHEPDGSLAPQSAGRLSMFLVGVERDTLPGGAARVAAAARVGLAPPPVCLNLRVMLAASFNASQYAQALRLLSAAVGFFQSRPLFDHHNTPDLDPRISRLALDLENLGFAELANAWGMLGGKYLPSVLYRVRMVAIDAAQVYAEAVRIARPRIDIKER